MSGIRTASANTQPKNLVGRSNDWMLQKVEDFLLPMAEKRQNCRLQDSGIMGLLSMEAN